MLKVQTIHDDLLALTSDVTSAFLIVDGSDLYLVDTGWPSWGPSIVAAIESLNFKIEQLRGVCVTHSHPDHAGSLGFLQQQTDFETIMHPVDAEMVREGKSKRTLKPSPGPLNWFIFQRHIKNSPFTIQPGTVDRTVEDGDTIPWAGGIEVVHLPGHAAGQIGLLWRRHQGVFFVADAAVNIIGLRQALASEDHALMLRSLTKIASYDFDVACFGHGKVIRSGAGRRFARKWQSQKPQT